MVTIVHGSHTLESNKEGQSVGDVRRECRQVMNIAPEAVALVHGEKVTETYILEEDDHLEFAKPSGEKGDVA